MADVSGSRLRGFILPSSRFRTSTLSAALSSYTQQAPEPSVSPPSGSDLVLSASGAASASTDIAVEVAQGGYPGRTGQSTGFRWSSAGGDARGWDPPYVRGWDPVAVRANGGAQSDAHPSVLALRVGAQRGTLLLATSRKAGAAWRIDVRSWSTSGWASPVVAATDGIEAHNHPALIELPSGRVVLYYWVAAGSKHQIRALYSDDAGATWATYAAWALPAAIDFGSGAPSAIVAAQSGGEVALICDGDGWPSASVVGGQYASSDLGMSFALIYDFAGFSASTLQWGWALTPIPSGILLTWNQLATGDYTTHAQRLGSAFQALDLAMSFAVYPGLSSSDHPVATLLDGRTASWADDDGTLWVVSSWTDVGGTTRKIRAAKSEDAGATWLGADGLALTAPSDARLIWPVGSDFYVRDYAAACIAGRVALACGWSGGGADDDSIAVAWLGGYSEATIRTTAPGSDISADWPGYVWGGSCSPTSISDWTTTTTGTPTETEGPSGLEVVTTAPQGVAWSQNLATTTAYARATWRAACLSGGSTAARSMYCRVDLSDGAASQYSVELWFSTAGVRVRDGVAGTNLALLSAIMTTGSDLRIEVGNDGSLVVQHSPFSLGTNVQGAPVRTWTTVYSGTLTQKTVGVAAAGRVEFGTEPGIATEALWVHHEHYADDVAHSLPATDADLLPRRLAPVPVEVVDGLDISAQLGPALIGETWDISAAYRYGIDRIDPREYPSPRAGWRSVDDSADQEIAWQTSGESGVDGSLLGSLLGVYLDGLNWRTGRIEGRSGGAWETLLEIDTAVGQTGLPFTRKGNAVIVNTGGSGTADRWWRVGEQVGNTIDLGSGAVYRCTDSSAGWWKPTGTGVRPILRLAASAGADPASGSMSIWSRRWVGVIASSFEYEAYRLVIDAQDTVDGDLRVGVAVVGPVLALPEYSWGRSIETAANTEITERIDGSRSAVKRGPARRTAVVTWGEARPLDQVLGTLTAEPDYLSADSFPLGAQQDLLSVEGMLLQADGPLLPVVYLPTIPREPTSAWVARDLSIYGRITEPVQLEGAAGSEDIDEAIRVLQVVISEEV